MWTTRSAAAAAVRHRGSSTAGRAGAAGNRRSFSDRGRGAGRGDRGGRGSGAFERFRLANRKNKPKREPSFAEKFLDPAARGELNKKHQSGIPKLAARKPKSKTAVHDQFPGKEAQENLNGPYENEFEEIFQDESNEKQSAFRLPRAATSAVVSHEEDRNREKVDYDDYEEIVYVKDDEELEGAEEFEVEGEFDLSEEEEKLLFSSGRRYAEDEDVDEQEFLEKEYYDQEYDSEAEYDDWDEADKIDPDNHPDITKDEDGFYTIQYNPDKEGIAEDDEDDPDAEYEEYYGSDVDNIEDNRPMVRDERGGKGGSDNVDLEERFFYPDIMDFDDPFPDVPDELTDKVRPLQEFGPNVDDFLEAMYQHPTKYAEIRRYNLHFESRREAKPDFPKSRHNPPYDWVKANKRFMYVTGLPHPVFDGELGDYDNPLHRTDTTMAVANLLKIPSEQVFPASMTSAFIGFKGNTASEEFVTSLWETIAEKPYLPNPVTISKYEGGNDGDFTKESPETIVALRNLPRGMNAAKLAHDLFPSDTELASAYGPLDANQILITSPTTALIRFDSAEKAEAAVTSDSVQERMKEFGKSRLQFFWTKRELVPGGFTGPNKGNELKRRGPRLIVDGDVPSKKFFISHAGCVHLRNLDDSVTKKEISDLVQPYCANLRDVTGSIEFVTCLRGTRTGRAFVGFDRLGEAEAFVKAVSGRIKGLGPNAVVAKTVKDKKIVGAKPRENRPRRNEEELLASLNDWEQYVDPKEIEELEKMGVNKMALDLAFRSMRYHNSTYGAMDNALRSETLVPERAAGEEYRETIREYIETVKECVATPENPGETFKALFGPNEELDLSWFDYEKKRQARIKKKLGGD